MTERQFDQITRVFLEETRGEGMQSMVGLISLSLPTIIERIERAWEMGACRFQISLPSWGTLRDSELEVFLAILNRTKQQDSASYCWGNRRGPRGGADAGRAGEAGAAANP